MESPEQRQALTHSLTHSHWEASSSCELARNIEPNAAPGDLLPTTPTRMAMAALKLVAICNERFEKNHTKLNFGGSLELLDGECYIGYGRLRETHPLRL